MHGLRNMKLRNKKKRQKPLFYFMRKPAPAAKWPPKNYTILAGEGTGLTKKKKLSKFQKNA